MPKDDKSNIRFNLLKRLGGRIQDNTDSLYRSTYYSDPANKAQLLNLKSDINDSIKNIINNNVNTIGEPNISKLYERIMMQQNNKDVTDNFNEIFGDNEFVNNLTSSYMDNRWIKTIDMEIDEVLRYMPKLEEALQTMRDNVLSADSFSKDFLNIEPTLNNTESKEQFSRNIEEFKKKYKLLETTNELYYDESKYGEQFVYCVPYQKAIETLLKNKVKARDINIQTNFKESTDMHIISESGLNETIQLEGYINKTEQSKLKDININISISEGGIIDSVVRDEYNLRNELIKNNKQSMTEQFFNESLYNVKTNGTSYTAKVTDMDIEDPNQKLPVHHKFDKTLDDELELPDEDDTTADGLITKSNNDPKLNNMNGAIVKVLPRERVTPILLNDVCLGYYYFEFDENANIFDDKYTTTGMVNTITGLRSNGSSEAFDALQRREEMLRYVAAQLANKIDTKFINANQDLKKEIYYILKYNDDYNEVAGNPNNIRVTFIPPEDIHHLYFKLNKTTNRGESDLALSLIPAKLWVAIYITNCLAIMTRGNDKRVFYVKQSVEQNIAKTMLKTINEIKKSNFGVRQVENINNVLNITGRFNDYIIPRSADGTSPIEFEVMQGQQIEIKTELLNLLEESAINITGVPIELIQSRQSPDYAIQLTMSNSKFLRFVYARQAKFQEQMSELYTKIYNIEYGNRDTIKVSLPPPLFINITNTNQLVTNTSDYCDMITNIILQDEQDDMIKAKFAKNLKIYYLGSYLNMNVINDILNKSRQEAAKDKATQIGEEM